jgi:aryl-alcohol dehydrogenase-like predicted oxidoreductase
MTASATPSPSPAAAAGTVSIGGEHEVNRLGFGAMRITGPGIWGPPRDHDESLRVLRRAVDLGVNFIDTADSYGPDVSEELIAEALAPYPEGLVIATKGGLVRPGAGRWDPDGRPEHLREALEGSLRRLRTEQVTLYQFHRPDPAVPLEESVGELARLRDEGKIRHVGLSNVSTGQLARARAIVPIVSVQNRYNSGDRASDEVVAAAERDGFAFIPWAPVGGHRPGEGRALAEVAARHGVSPVQVALAWQLARSPQMLPIPGTSSVAHLEENVAAAALVLDSDDLSRLAA